MSRILKPNFSQALRHARRARGKAQEDLDEVTGRTYISAMERGVKQPTIGKLAELAAALDVHPVTLMAMAYLSKLGTQETDRLLSRVRAEVAELASAGDPS